MAPQSNLNASLFLFAPSLLSIKSSHRHTVSSSPPAACSARSWRRRRSLLSPPPPPPPRPLLSLASPRPLLSISSLASPRTRDSSDMAGPTRRTRSTIGKAPTPEAAEQPPFARDHVSPHLSEGLQPLHLDDQDAHYAGEIDPLGIHVKEAIATITRLEGLGLQRLKIPLPKCIVLGKLLLLKACSGTNSINNRGAIYWKVFCD